jgi:hypothetical protein
MFDAAAAPFWHGKAGLAGRQNVKSGKRKGSMKIVPIALSGDFVDVVKATYENRVWILNISCYGKEGKKELTIR